MGIISNLNLINNFIKSNFRSAGLYWDLNSFNEKVWKIYNRKYEAEKIYIYILFNIYVKSPNSKSEDHRSLEE